MEIAKDRTLDDEAGMAIACDGSDGSSAEHRISSQLGVFGPWHRWVYLCMFILAFISGNTIASYNFVAYPPKHRCYVPNCDNNETRFSFANGSFPAYVNKSQNMELVSKGTSCEAVPLESNQCDGEWNGTVPAMEKCERLIFDQSVVDSSIVTTYGLTCGEESLISTVGSLMSCGALVFVVVTGCLADLYGRWFGISISSLLTLSSGLLAIVMPNIAGFGIMRFFMGGGINSLYMVAFVVTVETMHPSTVMVLSTFLNIAYAFGGITIALEAFFVRDWRMLSFIVIIPNALAFILYWVCPESPRWLMATGRVTRTRKVIAQAARWNGKDPTLADVCMAEAIKQPVMGQPDKVKFRDLLASPLIRMRLLNMCFQWFTVVLSFYGLTYASTDFYGNQHVNFALTFVMEIIGYLMMIYTSDWVGRRWQISFFQLLTGMTCIVGGFLRAWESPPVAILVLSTALCMIGKLGASACFAVIFLYTSELHPTAQRAQVVGMCSSIGRIGGACGFLSALLADIWIPMPTVLFGCFPAVAGVLALSLPETVGLSLPETVHEAEAIKWRTPVFAPGPRFWWYLDTEKH